MKPAWIACVALSAMFPAGAQDVVQISLFRTGSYEQLTDADPVPIPESALKSPFTLLSVMEMSGEFLSDPDNLWFVRAVTVQPPTGQLRGMDFFDVFGGFVLFETFPSASALEAAFAAGRYRYTFGSLITGDSTFDLSLPDATLPAVPRVVNFAAAQTVDPGQLFVLQWAEAAPSAGGARLRVFSPESGEVVYDSGVIVGEPTSAAIPAGSLQGGRTYAAEIMITRIDVDESDGVPGLSAESVAVTTVPLTTTSGGGGSLTITSISSGADGSVRFVIDCSPGLPLELQSAPALGPAWETVSTATPESTPTTLVVPAGTVGDLSFFRAVQ